jgi:hypothetical protein
MCFVGYRNLFLIFLLNTILINCLNHLANLSQILINFICPDGSKFVLPVWIEPKYLDLCAVPSEGDCFVACHHL